MKTFAFIDVIGIKRLLHSDPEEARTMFAKFWQTMDVFINNPQENRFCAKPEDPNCMISIDVAASVFSDSALIQTYPETRIDDFYNAVLLPLKSVLDRQKIPFYCVVSCGDYQAQSDAPLLGGYNMGSSHGCRPLWNPVAGSGDAWMNIFLADEKIKTQHQWHGRFSLYAINNASLYSNAETEPISINQSLTLYACAWPTNHG